MAFPTTGILDNFNRVDQDLSDSSNWVDVQGNLRIVSNEVHATSGTAHWSQWTTSEGPDCECYVTLSRFSTAINVYARMTTHVVGTTDGYRATAYSDDFLIYRVDGGSGTVIDSVVQANNSGDKIGISCIGSAIKGYYDSGGGWSELCSATDSNHTAAGYPGIRGYAIADEVDDFGGGTIAGGVNYNHENLLVEVAAVTTYTDQQDMINDESTEATGVASYTDQQDMVESGLAEATGVTTATVQYTANVSGTLEATGVLTYIDQQDMVEAQSAEAAAVVTHTSQQDTDVNVTVEATAVASCTILRTTYVSGTVEATGMVTYTDQQDMVESGLAEVTIVVSYDDQQDMIEARLVTCDAEVEANLGFVGKVEATGIASYTDQQAMVHSSLCGASIVVSELDVAAFYEALGVGVLCVSSSTSQQAMVEAVTVTVTGEVDYDINIPSGIVPAVLAFFIKQITVGA